MTIVVGGQTRNAGKTQAVCDIIAATRDAAWVAIKITPHTHVHRDSSRSDTARYLAAGAAEALLLTLPFSLPAAANLIIESNSILDVCRPDIFVFVADSQNPDWKDSARRVAGRADFTVDRRLTQEVLDFIRARMNSGYRT